MKASKNTKISAAIFRGVIMVSVLTTALTLRAKQDDVGKAKYDATSSQQTARSDDTATCLNKAAKMNMATIKVAELATQKAENAELKRFSQALEKDHTKAQSEVERIAQKHNVTLQTSLDPKCEAEISRLQALSGAEFDKEFAKGAIEGHAMALQHLQKASQEAKDSDLAQYTKDMLSRVKSHQRQAREVAKAVGVDEATITSLENKAKDSVGSPGETTETGTSSSKASDRQDPKGSPSEK